MIGYRKRVKLVLSILLISVPLVAYIFFCASEVAFERFDDVRKYHIGSDGLPYDKYDPIQQKYYDDLSGTSKANNPDAYYVEVTVGAVLEKIKNISPSTSSYETRMQLYFKFDKDEFLNMFRHYARNVLSDQIIDDYYAESEESRPVGTIEFESWLDEHGAYFEEWVESHDHEYYPGETPSNVLTDKETMFVLGNGEFVPDSLGSIKELEEVQYYDENGNLRTLCYQKIRFNGAFEKGFDSVRYPLDSVQFKMYILPTMDADYVRYVPDTATDSDGVRVSGFTPYFGITSGYRLIHDTDKVDNFTLRINYYADTNNDPAVHFDDSVRTQLEIIVRANRAGVSLFLQAFINLFSVVIWIIIAFYSQSYTGEDSVGMLGTGLFGVISSMLVGLSMVSDAGIFSLITMINIFTLSVIMIMTYQAIAAKRAQVRNDKVLIAYNGIKLRVLFILLTLHLQAVVVPLTGRVGEADAQVVFIVDGVAHRIVHTTISGALGLDGIRISQTHVAKRHRVDRHGAWQGGLAAHAAQGRILRFHADALPLRRAERGTAVHPVAHVRQGLAQHVVHVEAHLGILHGRIFAGVDRRAIMTGRQGAFRHFVDAPAVGELHLKQGVGREQPVHHHKRLHVLVGQG